MKAQIRKGHCLARARAHQRSELRAKPDSVVADANLRSRFYLKER